MPSRFIALSLFIHTWRPFLSASDFLNVVNIFQTKAEQAKEEEERTVFDGEITKNIEIFLLIPKCAMFVISTNNAIIIFYITITIFKNKFLKICKNMLWWFTPFFPLSCRMCVRFCLDSPHFRIEFRFFFLLFSVVLLRFEYKYERAVFQCSHFALTLNVGRLPA